MASDSINISTLPKIDPKPPLNKLYENNTKFDSVSFNNNFNDIIQQEQIKSLNLEKQKTDFLTQSNQIIIQDNQYILFFIQIIDDFKSMFNDIYSILKLFSWNDLKSFNFSILYKIPPLLVLNNRPILLLILFLIYIYIFL